MRGGLDDLIHLDDVRVPHQFQNVDFTGHPFDICNFGYFRLVQDLDRHLLLGEQMGALLDFAEGALAQGFGYEVAADNKGLFGLSFCRGQDRQQIRSLLDCR